MLRLSTLHSSLVQPSWVHNHTRRRLVNPTIIIVSIQRLDKCVVREARVVVVGQLLSIRLASNEIVQAAQSIRTAFAFTAANSVEGYDAIVQAHANEFVRGVRLVVAILLGVVIHSAIVNCSWVWLGAADDFCDEFGAKGSDSGHTPVSLGVGRELREVGVFVVVVDAHCCQDRDDDIVVGKIRVEWTAQWEVCCVVCDRAVDAAVAFKYVLVVQAS